MWNILHARVPALRVRAQTDVSLMEVEKRARGRSLNGAAASAGRRSLLIQRRVERLLTEEGLEFGKERSERLRIAVYFERSASSCVRAGETSISDAAFRS